jgi:hypothetical protein
MRYPLVKHCEEKIDALCRRNRMANEAIETSKKFLTSYVQILSFDFQSMT